MSKTIHEAVVSQEEVPNKDLWKMTSDFLRSKDFKIKPTIEPRSWAKKDKAVFSCSCCGCSDARYQKQVCPVQWSATVTTVAPGRHKFKVVEHNEHEEQANSKRKKQNRGDFMKGLTTIIQDIPVKDTLRAPTLREKAREVTMDSKFANEAGRKPFTVSARPGWQPIVTEKQTIVPLVCTSCKTKACKWLGAAVFDARVETNKRFILCCNGDEQHDPDGQRVRYGTTTSEQLSVLQTSQAKTAAGRLVAVNKCLEDYLRC